MNSCHVCVYLLKDDCYGKTELYCNWGQLRRLDRTVPPPDWCPNGGLPDTGKMTDEEYEADQRARNKVDGRADCAEDMER